MAFILRFVWSTSHRLPVLFVVNSHHQDAFPISRSHNGCGCPLRGCNGLVADCSGRNMDYGKLRTQGIERLRSRQEYKELNCLFQFIARRRAPPSPRSRFNPGERHILHDRRGQEWRPLVLQRQLLRLERLGAMDVCRRSLVEDRIWRFGPEPRG